MAPRGTRTRKISERMRVFDEDTRREITRRRLESLEKDNWQEERRKEEDEDEEEYVLSASSGDEVAVSAAKKQRRKKQKKRDAWNASQQCKTLQEIIDEAQYHKYPSWVPTYVSIDAKPSQYPPRRFCSVSGVAGKYRQAISRPAWLCWLHACTPVLRPNEDVGVLTSRCGTPQRLSQSSVAAERFCYRCPVTGDYLGSLDAYSTHRDTRLKGLI